jgi:hypothetical protein
MIIEMQNASKEKTENKTRSIKLNAIIFRERITNRFQRVSIRY